MKKRIILTLLSLTLILTACQGKGSYENKYEMAAGATKEEVQEKVGQTPSAQTEESNTQTSRYEDMEYCGHKGTMTFYFSEDALTLTQWDTTSDKEKDALEIYEDIKSRLTDKYGEASQNDDTYACNWYTDEKQISLNYTDGDAYKVTVVEYNSSGNDKTEDNS